MILILELSRGLAALWVFFFHARPLFEYSSEIIYQISSYGSLGVPMFFVISGYVITFSAESSLVHKRSPLTFLKNRFLRIYPTFWASVIVVLALPYLIESVSALKSGLYIKPEDLVSKLNYTEWLSFISLTKVFLASSHDLQAEFNVINSVYWTLAIEFQFYVIVFLALFFKSIYRHIIIFVSIFAFIILVFQVHVNYGLFIHYWPSFSVGIALAYLHRNGFWFKPRLIVKVISLVVYLIIIFTLLNSSAFYYPVHYKGLFFALLFGILLWIISDFESVLVKIKNCDNKLAYLVLELWLILGAMSYSVYLLHGKLFQFSNMFVRQIFQPSDISFGLLTILLTLLICYPFYVFIESRFLSKNYYASQKKF